MPRSRFPADRTARIVGWTTAVVAWGAVIATRAAGSPTLEPAATKPDTPQPIALEELTTAGNAFPNQPASGLAIVRVGGEEAPANADADLTEGIGADQQPAEGAVDTPANPAPQSPSTPTTPTTAAGTTATTGPQPTTATTAAPGTTTTTAPAATTTTATTAPPAPTTTTAPPATTVPPPPEPPPSEGS